MARAPSGECRRERVQCQIGRWMQNPAGSRAADEQLVPFRARGLTTSGPGTNLVSEKAALGAVYNNNNRL
eukprot:6049970-Prymnesium_polylepis.1